MKQGSKNISRGSVKKRTGTVFMRKRDPKELDRLLDTAIADSMAASDPPTVSNTEIKVTKASPEAKQ